MRYTRPSIKREQNGFTIVELMIATLIFSVIMLIITAGVIHFTSSFYKGVNASTTQNTVRSITDTVGQAIQFSAKQPSRFTVSTTVGAVCAGTTVFIYHLGQEVAATNHGLQAYSGASCPATASQLTALSSGTSGQELLQHYMHLADFTVAQTDPTADPTLWNITVRVAYADDDSTGGPNSLLCAPNVYAGSCSSSASLTSAYHTNVAALKDLHCRSQTGLQFCSVANLTTTVEQRINTGG